MNDFLGSALIIAGGIGTTFLLTVVSFAIGGLIAIPLVVARTSSSAVLRVLSGSYIAISRGIPPIAWLFVLFFGLGQLGIRISSLSAAIAGLSIISAGYLAEIYRAGLRAVPGGQDDAARALGLSPRIAFYRVIAPQAIATVVPLAVAYFIGLLKDSAVASVIGVQDITAFALSLSKRELESFTIFLAAGAVYLVISIPVAILGRWLGARISRLIGVTP